jgi:YD repeat-containing protein
MAKGSEHDDSNTQGSPEEKAMKETSNRSEFRSFTRARQIVGGVTMLLALTLAGPPRLWGDCQQAISGLTFTKGSINALPVGDVGLLEAMGTVTLNCPNSGYPQNVYISDNSSGVLSFPGQATCYLGLNYCNFPMGPGIPSQQLTTATGYTVTASLYLTSSTASAGMTVIPLNQAVSPADNGRPKCIVGCGHPINITNGNVWMDQRDYSVPGLGGGLSLSRVWNSQWFYSSPPALAGMFGLNWRSTYEEQLLAVDSQTLQYWRGDGSAWTFTYNSALNSYSLSSPPDERAQLVANLSGGFTLTFADRTQKVFNGNNQLAAILDRNGNQTTLAYDSSNRLTTVTSAGGTTLTFAYGDPNNPMQATTVADTAGTVATYTYDSSSRLTMVTYADGSKLNFANDPNISMILSVTDSQGKLLESHTYDAQDRGLTSSRAYGVDSVSLTY